MKSPSTNHYCLTIGIFLAFSWLCICFTMPYWKTIRAPAKIDLGILSKTFPELEKISNRTTGIISSFSIDIGMIYTCFNLHERFCSHNNQLQEFLLFVKLPEAQHALIFVLGLSCLFAAFIFSILLICCPNSCSFCFLLIFLFSSLIMLLIAIVSTFFIIETFNNWASFGFVIGTIFVFILLLYYCVIWEEYKKGQRLRFSLGSESDDLTISMIT